MSLWRLAPLRIARGVKQHGPASYRIPLPDHDSTIRLPANLTSLKCDLQGSQVSIRAAALGVLRRQSGQCTPLCYPQPQQVFQRLAPLPTELLLLYS